MSALQGASIGTAMTVAWVAGWLSGLWVGGSSRRRSGGPPPLGYRSITYPDPSPGRQPTNPYSGGPVLTEGQVQRGNLSDEPSTPKPVIRPTGQGIWQPQSCLQQGNPNPPPRTP